MSGPPTGLRYEFLDEAMGVGPERPRLSWIVQGLNAQRAYELETRDWSSGRVESAESSLVEFAGPLPGGGERTEWRVRVWTVADESPWSEWAWWERGLDESDWTARWISPVETERTSATHLLRTSFVSTDVARARLYITAHGIYEARLNGARVGDLELTPGYTEYRDRLQVQTFDVTDQLRAENVLEVELSDGWYRGKVGLFRFTEQWGDRTALLAQLVIEHPDATVTTVTTDGSWRSARTTHLADLIDGETVDLRDAEPAWHPVDVLDDGYGTLVSSPSPPVRRIQELAPVSVTRVGESQVVDLGQNITGWIRMRGFGSAGSRVTLTFGEELGPDGDVTQVNIEPDIPMLDGRLPAGQVDTVFSDGDHGHWLETRHSTKGFRYVRVAGLDHDLSPDDLRGIVVHTDMRRTGTFECSDDRLNRLHDAAVWSFRGNVVDIPTDCPHRERAGWTGDWQIYFPTASYLYDVAGFSTKWLLDVKASQWNNGVVGNLAPGPWDEVHEGTASFANGSAGWGDACVIVPWEQYQAYGDKRILEQLWPTMVRWIEHVRSVAEEARHPSRIARSETPLPHEQYLWDTGFQWGEWLEPMPPGVSIDFPAFVAQDKADVATAYYRRSTDLMARIATVLGKPEARDLAVLSERIRAAWCTEFLGDDGTVVPATQANCVRALAFDLVPVVQRGSVADQLAELVHAADDHLATGFLSTGMLLPTLADNGYADLAFTVLQQRTWPSWLDMIDQGATTMWERWEGWTSDGQPHESHNHFSKGAVITFLHRHVAGIRPIMDAPGYRRFEIRPLVGGGITSARGRLETPHGVIESSWTIEGDHFAITIVVPVGTSARVTLPDGITHGAMAGTHRFSVTVPLAQLAGSGLS